MRRPAFLVICTVVAGCAGPRPDIPRDATITPPAAWRVSPEAAPAEISATWWQAFNDPALTRIVEAALAHNTDVALAASRVAEARGQFHLERAQRWPDVTGVASGGRDRDVSPFGSPEYQTSGQAELSISYDLDLFGRLASLSEAARAALLSNEAARDNVRLAVAASAASGYIMLRSFDAQLDVLKRTLEARAESLRIARRRAETGYASQLDLAQAEADYRSAEQQIPVAELAITRQENGLSILLGESPRAIERGVDFDKLLLPTVPVSVPAALMRRRPDVIAAEEQLAASDRALDAARAAYMPDVQLTADGGVIGSNLIPSPISIFSLGGSILAPILDAGRLDAQQEITVAQRDQAAFAYRKTVLTAFREVEDAMAALRDLKRQEAVLAARQQTLQRALTLATNRYRSGYSPYLDQLDTERELLASELTLVQVHADRLTSAVTLFQALGGGWATK